jgi:Putative nuclear envelope organisation protein
LAGEADSVYNAWHKSDLEKWLDDHDIPYPTPADRRDLHDAVAKNWDKVSRSVYETWEDNRLRQWLERQAIEFDVNGKKDALVEQVRVNWYGAKEQSESSWESVKDWIFDSYCPPRRSAESSWSESHLKTFLDEHGIPCPQPRTRDALLAKARHHYHNIKKSVGDRASVPGTWLFNAWADSDLKSWCDYRGIPVPQGSKRNEVPPRSPKANQLIALVRRNMRKAKFQGKEAYLGPSKVTDKYSEGSEAAESVVKRKVGEAFEEAIHAWSESRLKSYLEERGVPVPEHTKLDELRAMVRHHAYRARSHGGFSDAAFDTWSAEQLRSFLGGKVGGGRDELISLAKKEYAAAKAAGGKEWASVTSAGARATSYLFDKWSESDLKSFLQSYGIQVPRTANREELVAKAKRQSRYFSQGPDWYTTGFLKQLEGHWRPSYEYLRSCVRGAWESISRAAERVAHVIKEDATIVKHRAQEQTEKAAHRVYEKAQQGYDKLKEEL